MICTKPAVTLPPPTSTFACVFAKQHFQPPVVVSSSQNNLLCFLIWNCVVHVFLSATNPRFLALPSPAPNLLHHAYSAIYGVACISIWWPVVLQLHSITILCVIMEYFTISPQTAISFSLSLPMSLRLSRPLSLARSFSHTLSLPSVHLCWR